MLKQWKMKRMDERINGLLAKYAIRGGLLRGKIISEAIYANYITVDLFYSIKCKILSLS